MKKQKKLDHLTRDVLAAQAAGLSYGNYKAMHPHTSEEDDEPEEITIDPNKRALVCIRCGKTFMATKLQANQKYCGDDCRYQAQLARQRELHPERYQPRQCQHCGKTLAEDNKGAYCNRDCRRREWLKKDRQKNPEKYEPRPCPVCGKLWVPSNGRRYCSQECSIEGQREKSRNAQRRRTALKKEEAENNGK